MTILFYSLLSAFVVGIISLVGAVTFVINEKLLNKILIYLVSFSAGSLIGGAFFHLLPEGLKKEADPLVVFSYLLVGFCLFFLLERILRWRHCHEVECITHQHLGWMNWIGDTVHNFIDGLIIFAAFLGGPTLGIAITISIIFHEIPQELGDFGVLVYSGFSRFKALFYNFISALVAIAGVLTAFILSGFVHSLEIFLVPFAAGGFIYIAASDLIPELHKQKNNFQAIISFILFVLALVFMLVMKLLFE